MLWLAYLLADTVAVFVLGHLAVHALGGGPSRRHELVFFWAPFMLVHLGGQDTITAFSKQDNELWLRHLASLVSQVAVAGYVVSTSSWPDAHLRAAMVLMFYCGSFKYAGRTYCLYTASPRSLRTESVRGRSVSQIFLHQAQDRAKNPGLVSEGIAVGTSRAEARDGMESSFQAMRKGDTCRETIRRMGGVGDVVPEIMSVDAPVNRVEVILAADDLPGMLVEFKSWPDRHRMAFQYVAAHLVHSYQHLYTKNPLRQAFYWDLAFCLRRSYQATYGFWTTVVKLVYLISTLFQYLSIPIALVLFTAAEKERHHSRADITVSYILLVGAILLDLVPVSMSIVSYARSWHLPGREIKRTILPVANCIDQLLITVRGRKKQWSKELGQYSMIKRHTVQDTAGMLSSTLRWICKHLGDWGVDLLDLTRTPVTDDLMELVLGKLLWFQTNKLEWGFARFHGQRTLGNWMERHQVPESKRPEYALNKSISGGADFPTSVLIWSIATDICYFFEDKGSNTEPDDIKKKKKMSRELSYYIMYLVFKCDVMLTSNSQLVHYKAHLEIAKILSTHKAHLGEKEALLEVFKEDTKEEKQKGSIPSVTQENKDEEPVNKDDATTSKQLQDLLRSTEEAIYSPVLPRARAVTQELIGIDDEADRWNLISEMWLEMLYYIAPRCGGSFHYEHLSTGGEFITHVLLLMRLLGPFLPPPSA
uniref:DUF4220 domain-containing protein n=1 Tax=Oryza punctata TaxID=4537 RepID=A0A0E0MH07_ORYPU